ncbi:MULTISPECIES: hypothetical protein [Methylobacterium]|uniref:Uncharacterized protein n=2 Tax=Methylobacterium TaxID=407 RepID=A0A0C6FNU9_9HYPH|nr:hypothetical protein [Methylobacterium aquaticum]BAQ48787.1 hypothetical protein Maq22A_1p32360 [Methylobacterium aquaticum]
MTTTILPFAPKGALPVRLPAAPAVPANAVLRASWSLDPETGRPVCRWTTDDEGGPARCPVADRRAA